MRRGELVLVVATDDHRAAFERDLVEQGLDVAGALDQGRLLFCEARETLNSWWRDSRTGSDSKRPWERLSGS